MTNYISSFLKQASKTPIFSLPLSEKKKTTDTYDFNLVLTFASELGYSKTKVIVENNGVLKVDIQGMKVSLDLKNEINSFLEEAVAEELSNHTDNYTVSPGEYTEISFEGPDVDYSNMARKLFFEYDTNPALCDHIVKSLKEGFSADLKGDEGLRTLLERTWYYDEVVGDLELHVVASYTEDFGKKPEQDLVNDIILQALDGFVMTFDMRAFYLDFAEYIDWKAKLVASEMDCRKTYTVTVQDVKDHFLLEAEDGEIYADCEEGAVELFREKLFTPEIIMDGQLTRTVEGLLEAVNEDGLLKTWPKSKTLSSVSFTPATSRLDSLETKYREGKDFKYSLKKGLVYLDVYSDQVLDSKLCKLLEKRNMEVMALGKKMTFKQYLETLNA